VLGMRAAGVGTRPHFPAAAERVARELFVDQWAEQEVAFIDRSGSLLRIDRRT
jgi:hypothetical protein